MPSAPTYLVCSKDDDDVTIGGADASDRTRIYLKVNGGIGEGAQCGRNAREVHQGIFKLAVFVPRHPPTVYNRRGATINDIPTFRVGACERSPKNCHSKAEREAKREAK